LLASLPTPQGGELTLVGCLQLFIQYVCGYPPYWKPFLHLQPEDTPCLGDRDGLTVEKDNNIENSDCTSSFLNPEVWFGVASFSHLQ